MVFCTKCGAENPEDAKYCQECGESLEVTKYEPASTPNTKEEQEEGNRRVHAFVGYIGDRIKPVESTPEQHTKEKKEKGKSPLTAAILNILIAGLGFVYIKEYTKAVLSFIIVWTAGTYEYSNFW